MMISRIFAEKHFGSAVKIYSVAHGCLAFDFAGSIGLNCSKSHTAKIGTPPIKRSMEEVCTYRLNKNHRWCFSESPIFLFFCTSLKRVKKKYQKGFAHFSDFQWKPEEEVVSIFLSFWRRNLHLCAWMVRTFSHFWKLHTQRLALVPHGMPTQLSWTVQAVQRSGEGGTNPKFSRLTLQPLCITLTCFPKTASLHLSFEMGKLVKNDTLGSGSRPDIRDLRVTRWNCVPRTQRRSVATFRNRRAEKLLRGLHCLPRRVITVLHFSLTAEPIYIQVPPAWSEFGQTEFPHNLKHDGNHTHVSHVLICCLNSKFTWKNFTWYCCFELSGRYIPAVCNFIQSLQKVTL